MLECVANVSEGRDRSTLRSLARACGRTLADVHSDADHNRSVFTIAGGVAEVSHSLRALATTVAATLDLSEHTGVHPRFGALDVVPFIAWPGSDTTHDEAVVAARGFADWWSETGGVPVFFYGEADEAGRDLPSVRREAFLTREPDLGGPMPDPRLGATAVGVRGPMVALNCRLSTPDVSVAREIAGLVRERDGGLVGVRALGLSLASADRAQVSMNLVDLDTTGVEKACDRVRELAAAHGLAVEAVELVGLVPLDEARRWTERFRRYSGLDQSCSLEARLAARRT